MFKGLGTWEHLFSHRCGKSNARPWRQQLWRKTTISSTRRKKLCHFGDVQIHHRSAEIFSNNVLARTFIHLPRQSNTLLHKCSGKAFPNYRGVCHSAWKWNASRLQTTPELQPKQKHSLKNIRKRGNRPISMENVIVRTLSVNSGFNFSSLRGQNQFPCQDHVLPMDFVKSFFVCKAAVAE